MSILLFDVDGTLTVPRNKITPEMIAKLQEAKKYFKIGIVGGSDLSKQKEQLGNGVLEFFDYTFAENGLHAFKGTQLLKCQSIVDYLGETKLTYLINRILYLLSHIDIPKRGTFIEFRNGMLNVSPIGRNCSQTERDAFEQYDNEHKIREKLVKVLSEEFIEYGLKYSIGGQISFDIFPIGWDKTYCLQFLEHFDTIHFFGDKTSAGGNDYEIYNHPRTIGHNVNNWNETVAIIDSLIVS